MEKLIERDESKREKLTIFLRTQMRREEVSRKIRVSGLKRVFQNLEIKKWLHAIFLFVDEGSRFNCCLVYDGISKIRHVVQMEYFTNASHIL